MAKNEVPKDDNNSDNPDDANHVNFSRLRVTDFKTNGKLHPSQIGNKEEELLIEKVKDEYVKTALKHLKDEKKPTNITESQWKGLKKLKKRVKNKENIITTYYNVM